MQCDLAVIGAGPAGTATTYFAAKAGLRVVLLDKARFPCGKVCGDGLTARAVAVLRDMGLEDAVNAIGQRITHATLLAPATMMRVGRQSLAAGFRFLTSPGYGWVFPVSSERANVGMGFFRPQRGRAPASVLQKYLRTEETKRALKAEPGPCEIETFPLRTDFLRAPLSLGRIWATGEAAGLVNPLTGEGIDYALESGRIAAIGIISALHQNLSVLEATRRYEAALHTHFDPLFHFSHALVPICTDPLRISLLARLAKLRPRLAPRLIQVLFGGGTPPARVDWRLWLRAWRQRG